MENENNDDIQSRKNKIVEKFSDLSIKDTPPVLRKRLNVMLDQLPGYINNNSDQIVNDIYLKPLKSNKIITPDFGINLYKQEGKNLQKLIEYIIKSKQLSAKSLIINNPKLLLQTLHNVDAVPDYSMKFYFNVTPFQAAILSYNTEMAYIIKSIGEKHSYLESKLKEQFNSLLDYNNLENTKYVIYDVQESQKRNAFDFDRIYNDILYSNKKELEIVLEKKFDTDIPIIRSLKKFWWQFDQHIKNDIFFNPFHLHKALEVYRKFDLIIKWYKLNEEVFWRMVVGYTQRKSSASFLQALSNGLYDYNKSSGSTSLDKDFKLIIKNEDLDDKGFVDYSGLGYDWAFVSQTTDVNLYAYEANRLHQRWCMVEESDKLQHQVLKLAQDRTAALDRLRNWAKIECSDDKVKKFNGI